MSRTAANGKDTKRQGARRGPAARQRRRELLVLAPRACCGRRHPLQRAERRRLGAAAPLRLELPPEGGELGLELEDAFDAVEGHAFTGEGRHLLDATDVDAAVAAL